MNKIIYFLFGLCIAFCPARANGVETAAQLLDKCVAAVDAAPSLSVKAAMAASGGESSSCDITLSRERFTIAMPEMLVWYDGATQWTYMVASQELSITEPFDEELLQVNPFAILKNYADIFSCRRLSATQPKIELLAKSPTAEVAKAVVTLDTSTYLPTRLDVTMRNGTSICVKVLSAQKGSTLPESVFKFNSKKYKVKETNDLR